MLYVVFMWREILDFLVCVVRWELLKFEECLLICSNLCLMLYFFVFSLELVFCFLVYL